MLLESKLGQEKKSLERRTLKNIYTVLAVIARAPCSKPLTGDYNNESTMVSDSFSSEATLRSSWKRRPRGRFWTRNTSLGPPLPWPVSCVHHAATLAQSDLIGAGAQFQPLSLSRLSPTRLLTIPAFLFLCPFSAALFLVLNYSPAMQTMSMPSFSKDDCVCLLFCPEQKDSKPIRSSKGVLCYLGTISGGTE